MPVQFNFEHDPELPFAGDIGREAVLVFIYPRRHNFRSVVILGRSFKMSDYPVVITGERLTHCCCGLLKQNFSNK